MVLMKDSSVPLFLPTNVSIRLSICAPKDARELNRTPPPAPPLSDGWAVRGRDTRDPGASTNKEHSKTYHPKSSCNETKIATLQLLGPRHS